MALIAQALVTAQEVEDYLQLQKPEHDVVVELLINGVSQQFSTYASRSFITAVYTSLKLTSNGTPYLYLPNWPVTTLTSVIEDGVTLTLDTDFYVDLDTGLLTKATYANTLYSEMYGSSENLWTNLTQKIVVTYTAGYVQATTLPADLKLAALKEVARQYRMFLLKEHGETSRSTDGSSSSYAEKPEWMEVVSRYRRIRV
jgi:hypothetical protein